jgi:hypothetical protein
MERQPKDDNVVKSPNHLLISPFLLVFFLLSVLLRLFQITRDQLPIIDCDEEIYRSQLQRMINESDPTTNNFLAGGTNFTPLYFLLKPINSLFALTENQNLFLMRFFFPTILSSLTVYIVFALGVQVFQSRLVGKVAVVLYTFSPFVISQSQIFYPDSYTTFFGGLLLYQVIHYYKRQSNSLILLSVLSCIAVSTKYTLVFLCVTAVIGIVMRALEEKCSTTDLLWRLVLYCTNAVVTFLIWNYSLLIKPIGFLYGFANNLAIYGQPSSFKAEVMLFYQMSMWLLPLGIAGLITIPVGVKHAFKFAPNSRILVLFLSPLILLPIQLASGQQVLVRSTNSVISIIVVLGGVGLVVLWQGNSTLKKIVSTVLIALSIYQFLFFLDQNVRQDSREKAVSYLSQMGIENDVTIGTNFGCGYSSGLSEKFTVVDDPNMKLKLDIYAFDMYWQNTKFYQVYERNPWYTEFNPLYIQKYHGHSNIPQRLLHFSGFQRDFEAIVPSDYRLTIVEGYGPDILILIKKSFD